MKIHSCSSVIAAAVSGVLFTGSASAADPSLRATLSPTEISVDQSANLTITVSGSNAPIAPPTVPGLEFMSVGQSQRMESINGITSSSMSITYQVNATHPGVYTIPALTPGGEPLRLQVESGSPSTAGGGGGAVRNSSNAAAAPTRMTSDGTAFVRLHLPAQRIYVGESIPLEVQVGTRDGMVASLNGLPTLDGDEFTLDNLASKPDRESHEVIGGKPYTVFTWRSTLAAVKPGKLSLTMETPLTIRVNGPSNVAFGDLAADDFFNDPAFKSFFGASTQKDVIVRSTPANFTVLELPSVGRPAGFTGAVGNFSVTSELSDPKIAVGDPETLRLKISGNGNFDRVNTPMLGAIANWKTYRPTARFTATNGNLARSEKIFDQPIVATTPGRQSVPALSFSYFDPTSEHYVTAHTVPLSVDVAPAPPGATGGQSSASQPTPPTSPSSLAASVEPAHDLTAPPHPAARSQTPSSLIPYFYRESAQAVPAFLIVAFSGAWMLLSRRERSKARSASPDAALESSVIARQLDQAAKTGDERRFFAIARTTLQRRFASRWKISPDAVTVAEVESRLGRTSEAAAALLSAEEALFAQRHFVGSELDHWHHVVLAQLQDRSAT